MSETRILPHAVELEEAILGALMLEFNQQECLNVVDFLTAEMFEKDAHKIIYQALREMYEAGLVIDILTVTDYLLVRKKLPDVGGAWYISKLTDRVATAHNIEYHARIVCQKWVLRRIIFYGTQAANRAYNEDPDIFGLFDELREFLLIEDKLIKPGAETMPVGNVIGMETEDYDQRAAARMNNTVIGVRSGLYSIDRVTNGWQNARLMILAARPAMGKTSLVKGFAMHAAQSGVPVAFFSLEMTQLQMVQSMLTGLAEIDNERYMRGMLSTQEIEILEHYREKMKGLPLFIDDSSDLSITNIRSKARRLKQKHNIGMIVVDYLQLVSGTKLDRRSSNREQEISGIARGLKMISKELNLPVIALSQVSRAVEARGGDKRPQLSDLRESGSLEQDADMVMFIYRPEYYGLTVDGMGESTAGKAELIIAKNRGGAVETIDLHFEGRFTKFSDPSSRQFGGLNPNQNFTNAF